MMSIAEEFGGYVTLRISFVRVHRSFYHPAGKIKVNRASRIVFGKEVYPVSDNYIVFPRDDEAS